jgi:L-ascorbate metabolism protein UlaG (beta-lactamase superfamily)
VAWDALENLDGALVSHAHYDHLDVPSLRRLGVSLPVVVPRGAGRVLGRQGFRNVVELEAGEETRIGSLTVRATEAEHVGKRGPLGVDAPALGFLVIGSACVYFAGDTDLFEGMSNITPRMDVALLPVAGWGPRLPPGHLDPLRAAQALGLLRPRDVVPIHWGTYRPVGMSRDAAALRAPADEFAAHAAELAPDVAVHVLPVGGSVELASAPGDPLPEAVR